MNELPVKFELVDGGKLPTYKTQGAAGMDCYANEDVTFEKGAHGLVKLGFKVEVPEGYDMELRGRSGLALKNVTVFNGVIDSDYRGEVGAVVFNNSDADFVVRKGERICQAVIYPVARATPKLEKLSDTERGAGGFGSTGLK